MDPVVKSLTLISWPVGVKTLKHSAPLLSPQTMLLPIAPRNGPHTDGAQALVGDWAWAELERISPTLKNTVLMNVLVNMEVDFIPTLH